MTMDLNGILRLSIKILADWRVLFIAAAFILLWVSLRYVGSTYRTRSSIRRPPTTGGGSNGVAIRPRQRPSGSTFRVRERDRRRHGRMRYRFDGLPESQDEGRRGLSAGSDPVLPRPSLQPPDHPRAYGRFHGPGRVFASHPPMAPQSAQRGGSLRREPSPLSRSRASSLVKRRALAAAKYRNSASPSLGPRPPPSHRSQPEQGARLSRDVPRRSRRPSRLQPSVEAA